MERRWSSLTLQAIVLGWIAWSAGCGGPREACVGRDAWHYQYPAFPGYERGCQDDRDCVVMSDLCGCSSGGFIFAVARSAVPGLEQHQKQIYPQGKGCPTVISAHPSCMGPVRATCVQHACVLTRATGPH